MRLVIDFETRSRCDLKKSGPWKYSEDPSTEVLCLAVKQDFLPAMIYTPRMDLVRDPLALPLMDLEQVMNLIEKADEIEAHNSEFEVAVWHHVFHVRGRLPDLPALKMRCSASRASMCSLPRSLGQVCAVLNLPMQKDMVGHNLMMKFCRPCKRFKTVDGTKTVEEYWWEDPDDFVRLCRYCLTDVEAEYALAQALPPLPPNELKVWQLDQVINRRGVKIDTAAVVVLQRELAESEKKLLKEWKALTRGKVKSPAQIEATIDFIKVEFGVELVDLTKRTVEEELAEQEMLS